MTLWESAAHGGSKWSTSSKAKLCGFWASELVSCSGIAAEVIQGRGNS
jgi:hypothetical protein